MSLYKIIIIITKDSNFSVTLSIGIGAAVVGIITIIGIITTIKP